VYAQGSLVYPVPLLDSPNSINNRAMADRLAVTLGDRPAALMKSPGAVTVGKTSSRPSCSRIHGGERLPAIHGVQIGKPYAFSDEEIALCREALERGPVQAHLGSLPGEARVIPSEAGDRI